MKSSLKVGIPTMLMLLFSVCLICFALLSFTSAYSDYKLSNKLITHTQGYYEACNQAYEKLNEIKDLTFLDDSQFYFKISDTESLFLEVNPASPSEILSWQVISTHTDQYDEHLNVFP